MTSNLADLTVPVRVLMPANIYKRLHRAAEAHHTSVGALAIELVRRALNDSPGPVQRAPREIVAGLPELVVQAPEVQKAIARVTAAAIRDQKRQEAQATRGSRLERIAELHARGLSDGQIGAQLGLTGARICQLRVSLGLPANFSYGAHNKLAPELEARIRELNAAGISDQKIAAELNISPSTVGTHRARLGLAPQGKGGRRRNNPNEASA